MLDEYLVPFIRPSFPPAGQIVHDLKEIEASNRFSNYGPKELQFSLALADFLGQGLHVTTSANGTLALLSAIQCVFGEGAHGKYLLTPSFTFIAVPQAAIWNGYRPWFVDIDLISWQASPSSARRILKSGRGAIAGILLPNVLGVGSPHIREWELLAAEWELPIVIDSAAGFGSFYEDGSLLGGRGSCEIFSFHATKPFTIAEGGAIASNNPNLVKEVRQLQNFGFDEMRLCERLGFNGKLAEIPAAIGLRQLQGFKDRLAGRRKVFESYAKAFASLGFRFQPNAEASSHFCFTMCCETAELKSAVLFNLERARVQARDYYNPPLHHHPYFVANADQEQISCLPATDDISSRIVSLPIHDHMPAHDIELVIEAVSEVF